MRIILPTLLAIATATFTITTTADAAPRVAISVSIPQTAGTLSAKLASHSRVATIRGGHAKVSRGRLKITPTKRTVKLTVRGSAPHGWSFAGHACAATHGGKLIACAAPKAAGGAPASTGGTTPAGGTTPSGGNGLAGGDDHGSNGGGTSGDGGNGGDQGGNPGNGGDSGSQSGDGTPYTFAPYADMAGMYAPNLAAIKSASGASHISLGFITESAAGGCTPAWGGYSAYPASGATAYQLQQVKSFKAAGNDVIPSFGGAAGSELATVPACQLHLSDLVTAYQSVIDTYGTTHIDFDIEGAAIQDTTANDVRDKAIVALQNANPGLVVSFTVQADSTGVSSSADKMIGDAVAAGVKVALVNGMAMDYYTPGAVGHMAEYAELAGTGLETQLAAIYPGLTSAQVAKKIGLTPMIGINDATDEFFTVADATALETWAASNHIGMLGMWSLARDAQCGGTTSSVSTDCSGVTQAPYAFATALGAFAG